jgi:hypothetical protein
MDLCPMSDLTATVAQVLPAEQLEPDSSDDEQLT